MTSLLKSRNSKHLAFSKNLMEIIKAAKDLKNYLKAIFGASSPQYGQIKGIVVRK